MKLASRNSPSVPFAMEIVCLAVWHDMEFIIHQHHIRRLFPARLRFHTHTPSMEKFVKLRNMVRDALKAKILPSLTIKVFLLSLTILDLHDQQMANAAGRGWSTSLDCSSERFILYVDEAMRSCVTHDYNSPTQKFFMNKKDFLSQLVN
ncbi:uncharacterized protein RSE6_05036 [Rhynchosporium secalis]|uniref:Uncharacterized protein n=1 Tax=Rhynchosporium secalis TaxID=38038 RepID=A0A1E1M6S5_RHYSE|nr:uncharacterized protein RSE6_05036 [Rhynchosporium secalis]